ncbi:hypothetical protein CKC_00750 [Candidatus Liberibacter solanacearum CLso-ZC1]|uniref:Uncharacterized protein n=1 Tax=Liberibacter solanacearum (strain CLso-ZC1) TaxID=658172 RepID=E4UC11_LIBSC|nr:hypothetical protein CKC_00750 [Candidatus Liberibacter solanacearum CLso-ZC1]
MGNGVSLNSCFDYLSIFVHESAEVYFYRSNIL